MQTRPLLLGDGEAEDGEAHRVVRRTASSACVRSSPSLLTVCTASAGIPLTEYSAFSAFRVSCPEPVAPGPSKPALRTIGAESFFVTLYNLHSVAVFMNSAARYKCVHIAFSCRQWPYPSVTLSPRPGQGRLSAGGQALIWYSGTAQRRFWLRPPNPVNPELGAHGDAAGIPNLCHHLPFDI